MSNFPVIRKGGKGPEDSLTPWEMNVLLTIHKQGRSWVYDLVRRLAIKEKRPHFSKVRKNVDALKRMGYIKSESVGRRKMLTLTQKGNDLVENSQVLEEGRTYTFDPRKAPSYKTTIGNAGGGTLSITLEANSKSFHRQLLPSGWYFSVTRDAPCCYNFKATKGKPVLFLVTSEGDF